jgi:tetratricopeptide (TPR) repeat protein
MMEVVLLRNRARAWQRLGRKPEAAQLFEQAIAVEAGMDANYQHPGHTRRVWARFRAEEGDYASARELLELAFIETQEPIEESTRPELLLERAVIATLEGQPGLGHDLAQRALAIREDSLPKEAWPLEVAQIQAALLSRPNDPGHREDARRLIQQLRSHTPEAIPAADRLNWLLSATDNLESR